MHSAPEISVSRCRLKYGLPAVLSSVLLLAVIFLWVRSANWADGFVTSRSIVMSSGGMIHIFTGDLDLPPGVEFRSSRLSEGFFGFLRAPYARTLGVGWRSADLSRVTNSPVRAIFIPYWLIVVALGLLSYRSVRLFRYSNRQRWRREHQCCLTCGYDLHGSPESRCPECGARNEAVGRTHESPMADAARG